MRMSVLAAAAAFAVASGAMIGQASAADLDYMPAPAPAPVPLAPVWQGFYIGGHLGYGEADFDAGMSGELYELGSDPDSRDDDTFLEGDSFGVGLSPNGLIGGVHGGYNWQAGSMVFGIEGDVSFADWKQKSTVFDTAAGDLDGPLDDGDYIFGTASAEIDMLASIRGRVGFAMDSVLIYGTGGVAWADATARAEMVVSDFGDPALGGDETFLSDKKDFNDIGFVVGGGMGWMVIPQTFSVGVEGLYYFFDEKKTLFDGTFARNVDGIAGDDLELDGRATASLNDAWVIRARADFHF